MWFFVLCGLVLAKCSDGAFSGFFSFIVGLCQGLWWLVLNTFQLLGWFLLTISPQAAKTYVVTETQQDRDRAAAAQVVAQPPPPRITDPSQQQTRWSLAELRARLDELKEDKTPISPGGRMLDHARVVS